MLKKIEQWYHFGGGVTMDNTTLNRWIREKLNDAIQEERCGVPFTVSSGDSFVFACKWDSSYIEIVVCTNQGMSTVDLTCNDGEWEIPQRFDRHSGFGFQPLDEEGDDDDDQTS